MDIYEYIRNILVMKYDYCDDDTIYDDIKIYVSNLLNIFKDREFINCSINYINVLNKKIPNDVIDVILRYNLIFDKISQLFDIRDFTKYYIFHNKYNSYLDYDNSMLKLYNTAKLLVFTYNYNDIVNILGLFYDKKIKLTISLYYKYTQFKLFRFIVVLNNTKMITT